MVIHTDNMRKFMEAVDYAGPQADNPDITYGADVAKSGANKGEITKVIAYLRSDTSGKYTKLGRNFNEIKRLKEEIEKLEAAVKADTKELVADLFHASDSARTRVVETVGFTFEMSKDPEASTTVQYSKVLTALEKHLTPELIVVLETIKSEFSTLNAPKSPSLKAKDKSLPPVTKEGINEDVSDRDISVAKRLDAKVTAWGEKYDAELDKLRALVGM